MSLSRLLPFFRMAPSNPIVREIEALAKDPRWINVFDRPVADLVPDYKGPYLNFIKEPFSFDLLLSNIHLNVYITNGELFYHLFLIIDNSLRFNKDPTISLSRVRKTPMTVILSTTMDLLDMSLQTLMRLAPEAKSMNLTENDFSGLLDIVSKQRLEAHQDQRTPSNLLPHRDLEKSVAKPKTSLSNTYDRNMKLYTAQQIFENLRPSKKLELLSSIKEILKLPKNTRDIDLSDFPDQAIAILDKIIAADRR